MFSSKTNFISKQVSTETVREMAPILPASVYPSVPSSVQATVMGGMSYEGYQDHRQVNAALLQQQLQQQQLQQTSMSTQATLQMAAMQIQQQQYGHVQQQQQQQQQQAPPTHQQMMQQPIQQQQLEDPQQLQQQQQQQHILSYAQAASMTQVNMPVMVQPRLPAAGATTVINGLPYQLQMNSDGTQVWVPLVPHTMTYSMPPTVTAASTGMSYQNLGQIIQNEPVQNVSMQQQQQ